MNFGGDSLVEKSGESALIRLVKHLTYPTPMTVLDVGANVGNYAAMVLDLVENAHVHCIEPSAVAMAELKVRFDGNPRVSVHRYAVGDRAIDSAPLWGEKPGSSQSSLYRRVLPEAMTSRVQEHVSVKTLDDVFDSLGVERLSLVKLDTEGAEYSALEGAKLLLLNSRIDVVQFEFGGTQIDAGRYLRDFYNLLTPRYQLFRILRDGLAPLPPYSERQEIFLFANYVAIRHDLATTLPRRAFRVRDVVDAAT